MIKYIKITLLISCLPSLLNASYIHKHFDSLPSVFEHTHQAAPTLSRNVHIFTANMQTAGRERRGGRPWVSPPNVNIYATYAIPFPAKPPKVVNLEPLVATSVVQAVSSHKFNAKFKWPNDIQIDGKKIGGVGISYQETEDKSSSFVIANVNLNVNMNMDEFIAVDQPATSMMLEAKRSFDKEEVLKTVTNNLLSNMKEFKISNQIPPNILIHANNGLVKERKFSALGLRVSTIPKVCTQGIVKGIDVSGGIIIEEEETNAKGIIIHAQMCRYEDEPKTILEQNIVPVKVVEIIPAEWQLHEPINSLLSSPLLLEKAKCIQFLLEKLTRDAHFKNISFAIDKGITTDGRGYIWISKHNAHKLSIHLGEPNASHNEISNSHVKVFAYNKIVDKFGKMRSFDELKVSDQFILDSHIPINTWSRWPMWFTPTLPAPIRELEKSLLVQANSLSAFQDKGITIPESGPKILSTPIAQPVVQVLSTPILVTQIDVLSTPWVIKQLETLSTPIYQDKSSQIFFNNSDIKLKDGQIMSEKDALDVALDFLGKDYKDMKNGRFVSQDGLRQVRLGDNDILGKHAGGPHINFEKLKPNLDNPSKNEIYDKMHIFLEKEIK